MALLRAREPYFIFNEPKLEENEKILAKLFTGCCHNRY